MGNLKYYRLRPQVVVAMQYDPEKPQEMIDFTGDIHSVSDDDTLASIWSEERGFYFSLHPGSWVVKDKKGNLTGYTDENFHKLYDRVE